MDYNQGIEYLRNTHKFGSRLGIESTKELLHRLGNPHNEFKSVHVAGTNGKGSVTAMIAHVLTKSGYKTGMFISPSLERFSERIQIDQTEIEDKDVARLIYKVKLVIDEMLQEGYNHPTEFEIVTAIGFLYFAEQNVDIAVVEVGLGGRLDSTNVLTPLISIITSISFDHMEYLGDTLAKIAFEKAGIIKANVPVVVYPQESEAFEVIEKVSNEKNSELFRVSLGNLKVKNSDLASQSFDFPFENEKIEDVTVNLAGSHQILNAATALTALMLLKKMGLTISLTSIKEGIFATKWPGRLEILQKNPLIILDGAHNLSGAKALSHAIDTHLLGKKIVAVIGILKDKQYNEMLEMLGSRVDTVIATNPDNPRALEPSCLAKITSDYCKEIHVEHTIEKAINLGLSLIDKEDVLLVTGSLYLIGAARRILSSTKEKLD